MSQQTAAARVGRTTTAPRPTRRPLQVVSAAPARGSGAFVALCALMLFAGLIGVLILNTTMAKGSFELDRLQNRSAALADAQETLSHEVDAQSAPAELARRALSLGMVPSQSAAFIRLSDGAILGHPAPATRKDGFKIATGPSVPAPSGTGTAATSKPKPTTPAKATTPKAKTTTPATKTAKPTTKKAKPTPTPTPTH
jgi:hypothetical protein